MLTTTEAAEYLDQIRSHVCSRCVERPPGGPPCAPLGKRCGVEMHLPQLIHSIHEVHSDFLADYLHHDRAEICDKCPYLHSEICPCPMDYLLALIVEAIEAVDRRHATDRLQEDLTSARPPQAGRGLKEIEAAFNQAKGTWTGCDWPTQFGHTGLDLNGWTSQQAEARARELKDMGEDPRRVVRWLLLVEEHARQAEAEAAKAVAAAQADYWHGAVKHARRARALEFATGRPLWRGYPLAWQPFSRFVEEAARALDALGPDFEPAQDPLACF